MHTLAIRSQVSIQSKLMGLLCLVCFVFRLCYLSEYCVSVLTVQNHVSATRHTRSLSEQACIGSKLYVCIWRRMHVTLFLGYMMETGWGGNSLGCTPFCTFSNKSFKCHYRECRLWIDLSFCVRAFSLSLSLCPLSLPHSHIHARAAHTHIRTPPPPPTHTHTEYSRGIHMHSVELKNTNPWLLTLTLPFP